MFLDEQRAIYCVPTAVPASASVIISKALADQDIVLASVVERERAVTDELTKLASRARQVTQQRQRRIGKMEAIEDQATAALEQGVEALRQALRDTPSTLRPDGHQQHTFPNQDAYDGEWRNTNLHGRGRWTSPENGIEYVGEWFLGVRAGHGTHKCSNTNTTYVGRWYEGKRHGKGELAEPEGTYRGEFRDHRFHGVGEYVYTDGHRYRGEFVDDRFQGSGTYFFPSGARYEGEWVAGLLHGKGAAHYEQTEVFMGEWRRGKRHGHGTHRAKDHTYTGEWAYDEMNGAGVMQWVNGDTYEGHLVRGVPEGDGTMRLASGATYSGEWHGNKRHGRGVYTAGHKRATFDGEWRGDKKHGAGTLTLANAGSLTGTWVDDELHGPVVFKPLHGDRTDAVYEHGECVHSEARAMVTKVALSLGAREEDL